MVSPLFTPLLTFSDVGTYERPYSSDATASAAVVLADLDERF